MGGIRLSICIPTYNFGRFIGDTLESILRQAKEGVEIVVVDGASTDDTESVVTRFQARFPGKLRYSRLAEKGGIDNDMAISVDMARGEYCWLFSADDVMGEDALEKILSEIGHGHDVFLCGFTLCDFRMHPIRKHLVSEFPSETVSNLSDPVDRGKYFRAAVTTTAFFSYMSSLVIRKSRWDGAGQDESFVGSCWAHVARIFRMLPGGLTVKYLPDTFLYNRGDNDSFRNMGVVHRIGIAVDGYHRLADTYFGKGSPEARHIRRAVANEYTLHHLLLAKSLTAVENPTESRDRLDQLVDKLLGDPSLRNRSVRFAYRVAPVWAFRIAEGSLKAFRAIRAGLRT